ncbi:MAG: hypothetical protein GY790_17825 [Bacteroidetes bacterium]|nr:hypothetical protein [Bacteroidota bacterium]
MKKILFLFLAMLVSCIPELTPPSVEITSPAEGSEFQLGETIEVRVTASDDDGTVEELRLYVDEVGLLFIDGFPYSLSFPTGEMEIGSHTIKIVATDDDGKEAEATSGFILTSTLPLVQTEQPAVITSDSVVLVGTILNDGGSTIQKAGFLWGTEANNIDSYTEISAVVSDDEFEATLDELTAETIYVIAFAENDKGRTFGDVISFNTIPPENPPPTCEILYPVNGSEFTNGDDIDISLRVTDDEDAISGVRIYIDFVGITTLGTFPYNYTYSSGDLDAGNHSLMAEVTDVHGATAMSTILFIINPGLPVVETVEPASITSSGVVAGGSIVSDGGGTITAAGVIWGLEPYVGNGYQDQSATITGNQFSVTLENLEYGNYYYIAYAENEAGRSYGEPVSFHPLLPENMFVDQRDNRAYEWVRIGTQVWMAENLVYLPVMKNSYNSSSTEPFYYVYGYYGFKMEEALSSAYYDAYGTLYNYPAAEEACPAGWHLPTLAERDALISYIGGVSQIGRLIETGDEHWNDNTSGTNVSGFSARGAGGAIPDQFGITRFGGLGEVTGWWMSDTCTNQAGNGLPFVIIQDDPFIIPDSQCTPFSNGYSIRCVKD